MKIHILVHIVWIIIMLFFGIVSVDQTGVFLCYLLFGACLHLITALIQESLK